MKDLYIEIVVSTKPRINAMANDTRSSVVAALRERYTHVTVSVVDNLIDLENLVTRKPDLVILGARRILVDAELGDDTTQSLNLSDYFKQHDITVLGSESKALALQLNKNAAKQKVIDAGLESARYFVQKINEPIRNHTLRFPLFVKPTNRGGSIGIDNQSLVESNDELVAKIHSIHNDHNSDALIEEYLPGREFSVAVVCQPSSGALIAMPVEIITPTNTHGYNFLSKAVKQADSEKVVAVTDSELKEQINALAIGVFETLGSRDYGRVDMRLDSDGVPSFIEANLTPGLSNHGYLSRCFMLNGQTEYDDMIRSIVALGIERSTSTRSTLKDLTKSYS